MPQTLPPMDGYREPSAEFALALAAAAERDSPNAIERIACWLADHARMAIDGEEELQPGDIALTAGVLLAIAQEMRARPQPLALRLVSG